MSEIDETAAQGRKPTRSRRRLRKILLSLGVGVLVSVLLTAGTGFYLQHKLSGQIGRIDNAFAGLKHRPPKPVGGDAGDAVNILLMGTHRSETLMVVHIDGDRRGASVISIPRDSWVDVPGHGDNTIDVASSVARPSLAVETVENLTRLRIDHLAVVDWEAFRELTDALGGLTLIVPRTVHDKARNITWAAGRHKLDGEEALDYADQHFGLPGGELDRIRRQQYFLRMLMDESLHQEFRKRPFPLYRFLDTVTGNLSVDRGWSVANMRGLGMSLRNMRSAEIHYITVPVEGTGFEGRRDVLYLSSSGNRGLWVAVREDHVSDWLSANPVDGVPSSVN